MINMEKFWAIRVNRSIYIETPKRLYAQILSPNRVMWKGWLSDIPHNYSKIYINMSGGEMFLLVKALKSIGAGFACSGLIGSGIGIGIVFGSLVNSYAINPKLKNQLFAYSILGFALSEAIALLALMMACIILYT